MSWGLSIQYERRGETAKFTANPNLAIPDADVQGIASAIRVDLDGKVKHVSVEVDIEHTYIGDLRVELISPSGQTVRLHDNSGRGSNDLKRSYDSTSTPELGELGSEDIRGDWKLAIRDVASQDVGRLVSWTIRLEF